MVVSGRTFRCLRWGGKRGRERKKKTHRGNPTRQKQPGLEEPKRHAHTRAAPRNDGIEGGNWRLQRVGGDGGREQKRRTKKKIRKSYQKIFHFWKASHTNKVQKLGRREAAALIVQRPRLGCLRTLSVRRSTRKKKVRKKRRIRHSGFPSHH